MQIAFLFAATCWTLWWNIQWKQFMKFYLRPPNRQSVQVLFRAWFALCLLGALWRLIKELQVSDLTKRDAGPIAAIAALMCAVIVLVSEVGFWGIRRRERRTPPRD
jgi:hypothetical protein